MPTRCTVLGSYYWVRSLLLPVRAWRQVTEPCTPVCGRIQVDNMHFKLYKELMPCQEQRERLASFWMRQERLKRQLDGDMSAARAELAALPSHIPLPPKFLSHLNALIASPSVSSLYTAADSQHASHKCSHESGYMHASPGAPTPLFPQRVTSTVSSSCDRGSTALAAHSVSALDSCMHPPSPSSSSAVFRGTIVSDKQCNSYSFGAGSQHVYPQCSGRALLAHCNSTSAPQSYRIPEAVRFMGQYPEDMVRAERSLLGLRYVMEAVKDLEADMSNAEMPGVLMKVESSHKLWSKVFLSQLMPPDMMEVCQIAATWQKRCGLFEAPFLR